MSTKPYLYVNLPLQMFDDLANEKITPSMFLILAWLHRRANWKTGVVSQVSSARLARELAGGDFRGSIKPDTVRKLLRALHDCGYIISQYEQGHHVSYDVTLCNYHALDESGADRVVNSCDTIGYKDLKRISEADFHRQSEELANISQNRNDAGVGDANDAGVDAGVATKVNSKQEQKLHPEPKQMKSGMMPGLMPGYDAGVDAGNTLLTPTSALLTPIPPSSENKVTDNLVLLCHHDVRRPWREKTSGKSEDQLPIPEDTEQGRSRKSDLPALQELPEAFAQPELPKATPRPGPQPQSQPEPQPLLDKPLEDLTQSEVAMIENKWRNSTDAEMRARCRQKFMAWHQRFGVAAYTSPQPVSEAPPSPPPTLPPAPPAPAFPPQDSASRRLQRETEEVLAWERRHPE